MPRRPIEFVDVTIHDASNDKIITGEFTDIDGEFKIEVGEGNYVLRASFMGYKTAEKAITTGTEQTIKIGRIVLKEDTKRLEEVQVVGQKSGMSLEIDKKVYNVGQDMMVKGGTVSDVLDNVPSVSVDVEGNVSLRGNDNVRILIDGIGLFHTGSST